jgi:hypothetical protein
MDSTQISKIVFGALGLACVMIFGMTGKIDGPTAMQAVTWIIGTFIAGAALLGGAKAVAGAIGGSSPEAAAGKAVQSLVEIAKQNSTAADKAIAGQRGFARIQAIALVVLSVGVFLVVMLLGVRADTGKSIGCKPGTVPTAVQTAAPPTEACLSRILNDALAGMTIEQIFADVDQVCAADLITIVATIVNSANASPATSQSIAMAKTRAFSQAMDLRSKLVPQDAGSR